MGSFLKDFLKKKKNQNERINLFFKKAILVLEEENLIGF
jgi:hypothetical protein